MKLLTFECPGDLRALCERHGSGVVCVAGSCGGNCCGSDGGGCGGAAADAGSGAGAAIAMSCSCCCSVATLRAFCSSSSPIRISAPESICV